VRREEEGGSGWTGRGGLKQKYTRLKKKKKQDGKEENNDNDMGPSIPSPPVPIGCSV
jgi:hypothetical protein